MRKLLVGAGIGMVVLLIAGYLALIGFASHANTTTVFNFSYAPKTSLLIMLGPQPVCPPYVMCPQFQNNPKAISAWIISEAPEGVESPLWQMYATVQHRKLVYILTP